MPSYPILLFEGESSFITENGTVYTLRLEKFSGFDFINFVGFKKHLIEISLIKSALLNEALDLKIKSTVVNFIQDWLTKNNKILFFLVSNANGKAEKRKIVFERWFRDLTSHKKSMYDLTFQAVSEKNGEKSYIGFIIRKDYSKFIEFKERTNQIVFDIEKNK